MSSAWKDFYESLPVPAVDFFERKSLGEKENLISDKKAVVVAADSFFNAEKGAYETAWADSLSSSVFLNGKKIVSCTGVDKLRFSGDGKSLYILRDVLRSNVKKETLKYDLRSKKTSRCKNFDPLLFARTSILEDENQPYAEIEKTGLRWEIAIKCGGETFRFYTGNNILQNIHREKETESELSFVFAFAPVEKDSVFFKKEVHFSKAGRIVFDRNAKTARLFLQDENLPWGIADVLPGEDFVPVVTENFYSRPLRRIPKNRLYTKECAAVSSAENENPAPKEEIFQTETAPQFAVKKYNPFKYYKNGVKLPLGIAPVMTPLLNSAGTGILGVTFISSNPWSNDIFVMSAGFAPFFNAGTVSTQFSTSNDSFSATLFTSLAFNKDGLNQEYAQGNFSATLWRGKTNSISAGISGYFFNGRPLRIFDGFLYSDSGRTALSEVSLTFSTLKKTAPKFNQISGFYVSPVASFLYMNYDGSLYETVSGKYANAGLVLGAKIPGFFPVSAEINLFNDASYFAKGTVSVNLFAAEIEKGIPALSIFVSKFSVTASYSAKLETPVSGNFLFLKAGEIMSALSKDDYRDELKIQASVQIAPNTSALADSANSIKLTFETYYRFFSGGEKKFGVSFGSNIAL